MANIIDNNLRTNADQLKWLSFLMNEYDIFTKDISALSLVGMMAHAMTDVNEATLYRSNQAIKESHVITANRYDSLYKHAREVELFPSFAIPSRIDLVLLIEENDFLQYATIEGDVATYTVTKDNFITVGAFIYSFDYDFEIRLENGPNDEKYLTAKYLLENTKNPISDLINPTIKAIRQSSRNGYVYQLYFTLKQYHREYTEKTFSNRDYGVFPIKTKRNTDEIAAIEVFHIAKKGNMGKMTKLDQKMYFENSRTDRDSIFLHYETANKFTLIHKSQEGGFRPASGDILQTVLYCTSGIEGDFNFAYLDSANIKFRYTDDNPLYMKPVLLDGISYGGQSFNNNKEKLRREIITKRSTRDSIIIENDLTMILNNLRSDINFNEYAVIKHRNDIVKVFNVFTTLNYSDQSRGIKYTIPTNTLNVEWDFINNGKEIGTGSKFYLLNNPYVTSSEIIKGIIRKESDLASLGANHLKYRLPFIIAYDKVNNIVRAYENYVDTRYRTDYYLLESKVPYSYICNWVDFKKEDYNKAFDISFQLRTNIVDQQPKEKFFSMVPDPAHPHDPKKQLLHDENFIEVYLVLEDKEKNEVFRTKCKMIYYRNDNGDDYYFYNARIIEEGEETVIKGNKIELLNPNTSTKSFVPIEGLKGRIEVHSFTERSTGSKLLDSNKKIINKFTFDCDLTVDRTRQFKLQHIVLGNDKIKILHVPLVEKEFYNDHKKIFRTALKAEYDMEKVIGKYQGEFSYSIKFINSYGYSSTYTIGLNKDPLNNVMLDFEFLVERRPGSNITEAELSKAVYDYMGTINFLKYDEFHVSNLYEYLYSKFPSDIKFIQFKGINGLDSDMQLISMNISEIGNDTIVEKLNIPVGWNKERSDFFFKIKWKFR